MTILALIVSSVSGPDPEKGEEQEARTAISKIEATFRQVWDLFILLISHIPMQLTA
jgi:hypothetical protein